MYRFDLTRWPIVLVDQGPSHTDAEFDAYLRQLEALYLRRERFVYVDVMPATMSLPPLGRIKRLIGWFDAHRESATRWCIGSASVIPNAAARGAANFFVRTARTEVPRYFARDLDEALAWAKRQLEAERLSPPSARFGDPGGR
jgi:hypothetical protein